MAKRYQIDIEDNDAIFDAVEKLLVGNRSKIKKGETITIGEGANAREIKLKNSFIRIPDPSSKSGYKAYAMANKRYNAQLGEGAYGKVKLAQDKAGHNFAVKIEGRGKRADNDAELVIMKAVGYTKGEEARQLSEAKEFKGKETQEKLYTMMELQEGKELFRQLYANALTPGQLYEPGAPKRNKEKLTDAQKLMIAIKCCQSIQDLHNRGIIHGDIKPANFMADINGNQIVLGTIDFGFSFKLQPGQTSIQSDGIPKGTHTAYMPPEVKRVADSSAAKAEFSAKSDIYSLGKMFKEDLGLPDEICEKMLKSVAADRSNLPDIIRELADTLEHRLAESTEANPEAQKLVSEVQNGVYQIKEHEGPKTRSTLVAQLLSGFRDPNDFTGSTKTSYYTVDEYKIFAAGLYARIPPETFFDQLVLTLTDLTLDDNDRKVVLHNANILIRELVKANPEAKHISETNKSLDGLLTAIKFLSADQFSDEIRELQEIKINLEKNLATKQKIVSATQPTQQKSMDEIIETITKTKKKKKRTAAETLVATELKQMQIDALAKINISDFHKLKWSKKKEGETLSSDAVSLTFNRISDMVVMDILNATSIKDQQKIYEFYLNVALTSLEQKDYQSAMAISAALERGPITRLKHLEDKKRVVEKRAHLTGELSSNMSYKKLRTNYEQALAGNESFIPYLGVYQTDLTFTGDGNPDTVRGKTNETKILQEGTIISKIQQVINSAKDHEGKPCQTNLQSRIFRAKFTDDELYDKSNIFYARNPVDLSNIKSLSDVTNAFPLGSIQTILRIKIGDDEFQGKKAFNKLFDMVMPLYDNPNLIDKYPEATALKILNSMEEWAKNNNMYKDDIREKIEKARNGLSPTPLEKGQMTQLDKREKEDIARYAVADTEQRAQIREELTQFKATSDKHIKDSIDKIIMSLNVLDQITKFATELNEVIAKPKDEEQDIHERYAQLARLSDIGKAIIPHAGSTNPIIQQEAQKVRDTLYSETVTELTQNLTAEAIAGLDAMPALYKDLLIERHRNKDDKSIGAKIKVITEVLSILQKDPNQDVKDRAKSTYEIIVNKLTKLDKCQKFADPSTTEEQKNSIARDILTFSKDDNVLVKNWAEKILNETPGLTERIQQVSDLDIQKAKQAELDIKNETKLLIRNLNSADGYKTVDEAKIAQKIKELQKQLDDIEKGPFEAASKVATTTKENVQPCIENLNQLLAHIEKMKSASIEGAAQKTQELIQKLEDSLNPSKATVSLASAESRDETKKLQSAQSKPQFTAGRAANTESSAAKEKLQSKKSAPQLSTARSRPPLLRKRKTEAQLQVLPKSEQELCQRNNLSADEWRILKIYKVNTQEKIDDWKKDFEGKDTVRTVARQFTHVSEYHTSAHLGNEYNNVMREVAVAIALQHPEKINPTDFDSIKSNLISSLKADNNPEHSSEKLFSIAKRQYEIDSSYTQFQNIMLKLSGKSKLINKTNKKRMFYAQENVSEPVKSAVIEKKVGDWFGGNAYMQVFINAAQDFIPVCEAIAKEYKGEILNQHGALSDELSDFIRAKYPKSDTTRYLDNDDSLIFKVVLKEAFKANPRDSITLTEEEQAERQTQDIKDDDEDLLLAKGSDLEQTIGGEEIDLSTTTNALLNTGELAQESNEDEAEQTIKTRPRATHAESPPIYIDPQLEKRTKVLNEFLTTENSYIQGLSHIYLNRDALSKLVDNSPHLTEEQRRTYKEFIAVTVSIHAGNQNLQLAFESLQTKYDAKPMDIKGLTDNIEEINKYMKAMSTFHARHAALFQKINSAELLENLNKIVNPKDGVESQISTAQQINKTIALTQVTTVTQPAKNMLELGITPTQRFPRYELLLRELLGSTSVNHPAYEAVKKLQNDIAVYSTSMNETVRRNEQDTSIGKYLNTQVQSPNLKVKSPLNIEFAKLPADSSVAGILQHLQDIQKSGGHPVSIQLNENDKSKNSIHIYLTPNTTPIATISIEKDAPEGEARLVITTAKNKSFGYSALEAVSGIANHLETTLQRKPIATSQDPNLGATYALLNDSKAQKVEMKKVTLDTSTTTTVVQQSTVVGVPTTAANDGTRTSLQVDSPENIAALSNLLAQKLAHTSSLVDEQEGEALQSEQNPDSPPTEHLAVVKGKTDKEPLTTPLSSAMDEETPLTVLSTQPTSILTDSIDPVVVDPSLSSTSTSPIAKSKTNTVVDQEDQGIGTTKPNRARANSMPSIPTAPKQDEDTSVQKKRAMSLSTHTDKPVWKEPPTRVVSKPIVPSQSDPSTAPVQPVKKRARQDLLGKARANAKAEALRNETSPVGVSPSVVTDPSKVSSELTSQTGGLPGLPTISISVASSQSNTPTNSPVVSSPIISNTSETPVVTNTSVQQSGTVLPNSRPPTRHTPHLNTGGFPPLVSDEFSHTQNLSLQQLHDFAKRHQQDFDIKEIKKFPDQQQEGLKGLEFVFKRDDATSKPVSAYATEGENQNIKFSVSKSLYSNDQSAAEEAIWKMCRLAVNAAEPNAVFIIPEKISPNEKREMVKACFERAIQEALLTPGTKFTAETMPKVVDKTEGPKKDTRLGGIT